MLLAYGKPHILVKFPHSGLPRYFGLTLTFKWMGLLLDANFPSGPRPCRPRLPSPIFWPNRNLHLVQGLSAPRPTSWAPFLKPSLAGTYAVREHVKPWVKPNPTLRLVTQVATRAAPWWSKLGSQLVEPPHLKVYLEGHVIHNHSIFQNCAKNISMIEPWSGGPGEEYHQTQWRCRHCKCQQSNGTSKGTTNTIGQIKPISSWSRWSPSIGP